MSFAIIAVGVAAVGAGYEIYQGQHQAHLAKEAIKNQPKFTPTNYAQKQYATAQQAYNSPMPGTSQYQQDIGAAQGNYLDFVNKNATDSGQALALGGLSQGMATNAYNDLQTKQANYHTSMLDNLNNAYQAMINENNNNATMKNNEYAQRTNIALSGAGAQSTYQGIQGLGSDAFVASQYFKPAQTSSVSAGGLTGSF